MGDFEIKYRDMKLDPYWAAMLLDTIAEMTTKHPYRDWLSCLLDQYVAAADNAEEIEDYSLN
jgi:hypothetical protein